jgi:hypothetical protein
VASATPITLTSEETSTLEEISSVQQAADRLAVGFRGKSRETDASQGVQVEMIQALADYWATDYDWRKFEERFSALPYCITEIDGAEYPLHPHAPRGTTKTRSGRSRAS